jgi:MoaA/NifB/PqqE/SkfB family radical SAM enzyme
MNKVRGWILLNVLEIFGVVYMLMGEGKWVKVVLALLICGGLISVVTGAIYLKKYLEEYLRRYIDKEVKKRLDEYLKNKPHIEYYSSWKNTEDNKIPDEYRVEGILAYLKDYGNLQLEVVGRTGFQWLCGDEELYNNHHPEFEKQQNARQRLIREAIKKGNSIHFILQNPNVSMPYFTMQQKAKISTHVMEAIQSYKSIVKALRQDNVPADKLKLLLTTKVIENSKARLKDPNMTKRIMVDLTSNFKSLPTLTDPDGGKSKENTPFFVLENLSPEATKSFDEDIKKIKNNASLLEEFEGEIEKGLSEVKSLIDNHSCHSILRRDTSRNLAIALARHILAERKSHLVAEIPPPVSIHLLVTNKCSTNCIMCDHYNLGKKEEKEMDTSAWRKTLDEIYGLGTRSVVISGGEPLMRKDIFEILEYGKNIKLNIGLLTNGVKKGGSFLTDDEAKCISHSCSWIQVSIDSFKQEKYSQIRGGDYLKTALDSVKKITHHYDDERRSIEICFTIQRDNIGEVQCRRDISKQEILKDIPDRVPIRYKFAHGPVNGKIYLCETEKLEELKTRLVSIVKEKKCEQRDCHLCNIGYLNKMITEDKYFDIHDLSVQGGGMPLRQTMTKYHERKYTCQVLRLTCTIDPNGNVYPCCFLFDDNREVSETRDLSKLSTIAAVWCDNSRLKEFRNEGLPIILNDSSASACSYCTRHFYQNEFLNEINKVFTNCNGVAEKFIEENKDIPSFFM